MPIMSALRPGLAFLPKVWHGTALALGMSRGTGTVDFSPLMVAVSRARARTKGSLERNLGRLAGDFAGLMAAPAALVSLRESTISPRGDLKGNMRASKG